MFDPSAARARCVWLAFAAALCGGAAVAQTTPANPPGLYSDAAEPRRAEPGSSRQAPAQAAPSATPSPAPRVLPVDAVEPEPPVRKPSPFEKLATEANGGQPVWRFGAEPRAPALPRVASDGHTRVPPDYPVQVGDELAIHVWGSVDGDWVLPVDRAGRIVLPRVGPVQVEGVAAADLTALLRARLERVFRGFEISVAVRDVGPVRVQVTGFVEQPGDRVLPGLSAISQALQRISVLPGGGSLRKVRLNRGGKPIASFDLYALLAEGERRDDRWLLGGDVLHFEAIGPQAAVLGSVNRPAVFEFLPGQTLADVLKLAGGFSSVADRAVLQLERMGDRTGRGVVRLEWPRDAALPMADGDLVRVLSQVEAARPTQLRSKRVRVEGEVLRPGDHVLPADATLADAVAAAGGTTEAAFIFGTELRRERVRQLQETNYLRALQELEAEVTRLATTRGAGNESPAAQESALRQLLARMRARRPEGRLVLDVAPTAQALPRLALEDGDLVHVPPRSQSVGVFGSVFNAGSFVHDGGRTLGDYLARAGGPTDAAEANSVFVVRANGSVASARQGGYWQGRSRFEAETALPGDTVFVPERLDRVTFVQGAKDWTQILYQLGVGLAALLTIR
jgi:protein involved in polysaccharide export with SLBB domain